MKQIYLMRHAKSSWNDPSLKDFDRPLNKRGLLSAPLMGDVLKQLEIQPDLIITSPANRALSTAKIIAHSLSYPLDTIQEEEKLYDANVGELITIVQALDESIHRIMIIGHNPSLSWFSDFLCDDPSLNLPTCGVCGIELDCHSWQDVEEVPGKCIVFDYPRNHLQD